MACRCSEPHKHRNLLAHARERLHAANKFAQSFSAVPFLPRPLLAAASCEATSARAEGGTDLRKKGLFVVVGFSDDRRLLVLILFVLVLVIIIIVVWVSRRQRMPIMPTDNQVEKFSGMCGVMSVHSGYHTARL